MTITIKDKLDLARTSHFHLDVPARLLSKIPQGQQEVLKWTRVVLLQWELLRRVTRVEGGQYQCVPSAFKTVALGHPKVTVDDKLLAGSRTWEPKVIEVWQCS